MDTAPLPVELKAGLNVLRLHVPTNRPYDLNSIKISPAGQELKNTLPIFDFNVWDADVKTGRKLDTRFYSQRCSNLRRKTRRFRDFGQSGARSRFRD
jgi:hypothetical protein